MHITPLIIQIFSMTASLFCVVFSVFSFIELNPFRVVVNIYILGFGLLVLLADIYCLPFYGYLKFIYTPLGRGLLFLLLGCVMIQKGVFNIVSGVSLIIAGALYYTAAYLFGGVPRPWLQKNLDELPLTAELRFVNVPGEQQTHSRAVSPSMIPPSQQGFRI